LHYQVQVLRIFYNALLLDRDFREYSLKREVIRKNYDQAEEYYKKSLELEPDDENANNNYAGFLTYIRKDYDLIVSKIKCFV
jgi:Tfp pilus assembly protein PilF